MTIDGSETCIYCKRQGSSREHVAPNSLGGNCTMSCVCEKCNKELSAVDQALAENSPVALSRIRLTPKSAFTTFLGGYASFEDSTGRETAVRVMNQMVPEVRPQIFVKGDQVQVRAKDRESLNDLIAFIDSQISKGRLESTRVFISEEVREPCFLMHRDKAAVVSSSTHEKAEQFLHLVKSQWPEIKAKLQLIKEHPTAQTLPEIALTIKFRPNDEFRGVAKIAFETVALLRGSEFVLQEGFDPIREYIKGDVKLPIPPPGEIAVDNRFVRRLGEEFRLKFTEEHGVLLLFSPPNLVSFVLLYGENPYFVRLATLAGDDQWLRAYEFSYTKEGHGELSELELAQHLLRLSSRELGISAEQASSMLLELQTKT